MRPGASRSLKDRREKQKTAGEQAPGKSGYQSPSAAWLSRFVAKSRRFARARAQKMA